MNHPACVSRFLWVIKEGIKGGYEEFKIRANSETVFPNACVPIAGIIDYYKNQGIKFSYDIKSEHYLSRCGFLNPLELTVSDIETLATPFDKLFKYNEYAQVAKLTQSYIDTLSHLAQCEQGVIEGIIWCINEVMDNVLVHSELDYGFIMSQFHPDNNHIAFCVYDSGVGIFNTLKNSKHHPRKHLDAISLSVQEGVGDGKGQGNGLFGLYKIVESNGGRLTITSGPASMMLLKNGERKEFGSLPFLSYQNNCTTIDFQLDINNDIDIKEAFQSIGGFDGFDIRLDDMLCENNFSRYDVYDNCEGTATRGAGFRIRNDVFNIIQRTRLPIILDFSKVTTSSSSFIDEFMSKLVIQFGILSFNQMIKIVGMNDTIRHLFERSTYMRIYSMWSEKDRSANEFDDLLDSLQ